MVKNITTKEEYSLIKTGQTEMDKCYGESFRWLREREGLTQTELQEKVNFNISEKDYIAKIESGKLRPIRSLRIYLANALHVDKDWFENAAQDLLIDKVKSEIDDLLNGDFTLEQAKLMLIRVNEVL